MKELIAKLLRFLGMRSDTPGDTAQAGPRNIDGSNEPHRSPVPRVEEEPELSVEELCEPTNDTVPNLRILTDGKDGEQGGYDPYETSSNFH